MTKGTGANLPTLLAVSAGSHMLGLAARIACVQ